MRRSIFLLVLFLATLLLAKKGWPWNAEGHKLHARDAYERLPKWEKEYLPTEVWERYYTDFCEYPDTRGPEKKHFKGEKELFEQLNKEFKRIGEIPGIPLDWAFKKDWPYLHGDYCLKVEFEFLVKALQERRFWDAGMWLGCISHWIGDRCAPGHCPMMFAWHDPYRKGWITLLTSKGINMTELYGDHLHTFVYQMEAEEAYYKKLMRGYRPKLLAPTLKEAALLAAYKAEEVYLHALEIERPCLEAVLAGRQPNKEIIEVAAHGTKAHLDIFHTAFMIATGKAKGKYKGSPVTKLLAESRKPLDSYFCYQGLIPKAPKPPMIGVLTYNPPCIYYDWGDTPFYTKLVLTELKRSGFNYGVITVDDLINPQKFNPQNYPVVIYPPTRKVYWRTYKRKDDCIKAIDRYIREGGSLLCMGGKPFYTPLDYLDGFWVRMKEEDNPMTPFATLFRNYRFPRNPKQISLKVSKEAESIFKDIPKQIEAKKDLMCLWDYERWPGVFQKNIEQISLSLGKFTPLLIGGTKTNPEEAVVAGLLQYENGYKGRIVFLPLYLIMPYFFTDQIIVPDEEFFNPRMDPVPSRIFKNLMDYLWKTKE